MLQPMGAFAEPYPSDKQDVGHQSLEQMVGKCIDHGNGYDDEKIGHFAHRH